jgi:glutamate-ammonia-ligase adenylyltransferase
MTTNTHLTGNLASRFCLRWINAEAGRADMVTDLARLSLSRTVFAGVLQNETAAGHSLPAAMRRLRNLIIATLITRDLGGRADLAEVVDTMSAFADFAIQTHLAALTAEIIAIHGTPIGEESGRRRNAGLVTGPALLVQS